VEEYLTTTELSKRIKMKPGTIRNLVWKGDLKINTHYFKPTPRKLLFIWSTVEKWLHGGSEAVSSKTTMRRKSLIEI